MRIGQHLLTRRDGSFLIRFPAEITKNHRDLEYPLDPEPARLLRDYLTLAHPQLPGSGDTDRLWLGTTGDPLTLCGLEGLIKRRNRDCTGTASGPHMARKWHLHPDGEPERGLWEIEPNEAAVVRRIYEEFVAGETVVSIVHRLNTEGVVSPAGRGWHHMTLRGRPSHGDGILRNPIYAGRRIWNRSRRVADPQTGIRRRRLNAVEDVVHADASHLRIVDEAIWEKAQRRVEASAPQKDPENGRAMFWKRRAPDYLLSGKIVCGLCGGHVSALSNSYYRCNAGQKRLCNNRSGIHREKLEAQVLEIVCERMMDPAVAEAFAETFTEEWNKLQSSKADALRRELATVERKLANLLDAIAEGLRSPGLQEKLSSLEAERDRLAKTVATTAPSVIRLMPNLGAAYRRNLAQLRERLGGEKQNREALNIARQLIDRVVLHPAPPRQPPGITVEGHLARMLTIAQTDLPDSVAKGIAHAAHLSVEKKAGGSARQSHLNPSRSSCSPASRAAAPPATAG